ncbi:MAG TPA: hypothetical protein PKA64_25360 [Myxococcota bacterium]|nr:hypothetical protein [Myxococcota bacterium]
MLRPLALALLAACTPAGPADRFEPWETPADGPAGPPLPTTLQVSMPSWVAAGHTLRLTASGATPGGMLYLVVSDGALGPGACPPGLGGGCLDLTRGSGYRRIPFRADRRGVGTLSVNLPATTPARTWATQVVDAAAPGASTAQLLQVVPDGCRVTQRQVQCLDTAETGWSSLQANAFVMNVEFAWDPATGHAAGWIDASGAAMRPRMEFRVGTEDGVQSVTDDVCTVTSASPSDLPVGAWLPQNGNALVGFEFDLRRDPPVVTDCGPNIDPASVDRAIHDILMCQPWRITVDAALHPDMAQMITDAALSVDDYLGGTYLLDPACGFAVTESMGYAVGLPLLPNGQSDPAGAPLTGAGRTTTDASGATVPARGTWWMGSAFMWLF